MSENILIVDDELSNRRILEQVLARAGYSVETADAGSRALEQLDAFRPDLIILDYMMSDLTGMEVLRELRKREDDTPVIMITAYGTIERAVEAIQEGAYDFITRPFKPDHLTHVVRKALERQKLKRGVEVLSQEAGERYRLIIGESAKMKQAVDLARRTAASSATVLLLGESGTGKEILCPLDPQLERQSGATVHRDQFRRAFQGTPGKRAVRLRTGSIHRRAAAQEGQGRSGARRDYFFRRDRRSLPRAPGKAFKIFTGARIRKSRRDHADLRRRESNCSDESRFECGYQEPRFSGGSLSST